jgi:hypothetical protein
MGKGQLIRPLVLVTAATPTVVRTTAAATGNGSEYCVCSVVVGIVARRFASWNVSTLILEI